MIDSNFVAKISDFGESVDQLHDEDLALVGTPLFVAPEILLGLQYDTKADVYSYGILASELSTRKKPYFEQLKYSSRVAVVGQERKSIWVSRERWREVEEQRRQLDETPSARKRPHLKRKKRKKERKKERKK